MILIRDNSAAVLIYSVYRQERDEADTFGYQGLAVRPSHPEEPGLCAVRTADSGATSRVSVIAGLISGLRAPRPQSTPASLLSSPFVREYLIN